MKHGNLIIMMSVAVVIVVMAVAWKWVANKETRIDVVKEKCIETNFVSIDVRSLKARPVYDCTGVNLNGN